MQEMDFLTIYAPPGSTNSKKWHEIRNFKNQRRNILRNALLWIRTKLSNESEGIIELNNKYNNKIGKPYFR